VDDNPSRFGRIKPTTISMESPTKDPINTWIRDLPRSKMARPRNLRDSAKYALWRLYTPYHPLVRNAALKLGVVKHAGRQNYPLGHITPGKTVKDLVDHLLTQGYANHFVAWKDDGELVSLRKVENFTYQYHIRIFKDGEIRGHYEYTPECYPYSHLKAVGQEDRADYFKELLGEFVI
jgi:hypothetical protein